jgi:hypothetical protein
MKPKPTEEAIENFTKLFDVLNEEAENQKNLTKKDKRDNSIKMGDIYY